MTSWVEALKHYNQIYHQQQQQSDEFAERRRQEKKEQEVLRELRKIYRRKAEERRKKKKEKQQQNGEEKTTNGTIASSERKQAASSSNSSASSSSSSSSSSSTAPDAPACSAGIPRFYIKRSTSPPPPEDALDNSNGMPPAPSLATQLRREARTRYLESRAEQLLDDRELAMLWETIQLHSVDTHTTTGQVVRAGDKSGGGSGNGSSSSPTSVFEIEKRLDYDSFLLISQSLPYAKAVRYFKASTFLSFPQDQHGRISSRALWRYLTRKIQLTRLRISLACYDDLGYGYLREQDLENYVYDQLGSLPPLLSLERDFYPYYVFTAVRKFIFFLDPHRRGKLRIKHVVESSIMAEFDSLRYPHGHNMGATGGMGMGGLGMGGLGLMGSGGLLGGLGGGGLGGGLSSGMMMLGSASKKGLGGASWFSAQHTQDVYAIYLGLDTNQNGMLSKSEFAAYNGGNLTNIFIEGLFATYRMYPSASSSSSSSSNGNGEGSGEEGEDGTEDSTSSINSTSSSSNTNSQQQQQQNELEMDYKTFLDFVLAMEYKATPASIGYFFKILDMKHQGYLDTFTLNYWFRAVSDKMVQLGHEPVDVADVVANEIFDMVCPRDPGRITLQDLIASRCGHTVISILIDVNGFWKYDNRESLMHTDDDDN